MIMGSRPTPPGAVGHQFVVDPVREHVSVSEMEEAVGRHVVRADVHSHEAVRAVVLGPVLGELEQRDQVVAPRFSVPTTKMLPSGATAILAHILQEISEFE